MIDPIKEMNNTIDELFLNNQQKNSNLTNRKSLMSDEILLIEKKENLINENLFKINSLNDMFDNFILFISKKENVKIDTLNTIKNNHNFLRNVIIENISFLESYFMKFNKNIFNELNENDIPSIIFDTLSKYLTRIKNFEKKFLNYLKKKVQIKEDNDVSNKKISKNNFLKKFNKSNRIINNNFDNNIILNDYKKETTEYLLDIKTMHVIYKLFKKGMNKIEKIIVYSQKYSSKINDLSTTIKEQNKAFDEILLFTKPKSFELKVDKNLRKEKSKNLNEKIKEIYNDNKIIYKFSTLKKERESGYISKYDSSYIKLNLTDLDNKESKYSNDEFEKLFKNKWMKLSQILNNLFKNELEYKIKILNSLTDNENFDIFDLKESSNKDKIYSIFDYFDPSRLNWNSYTQKVLSKYGKKLNETVFSLDDKPSYNINLDEEIKIMEKILNQFDNYVKNNFDKRELNMNENDDFNEFAESRSNLERILLVNYLDILNENLNSLKNIYEKYLKIKENLLELSRFINILVDKKIFEEKLEKIKKEEDKTVNESKNSSHVLEELKNKSFSNDKNLNDNLVKSIKLNVVKNNKLVKNSSDTFEITNITLNVTSSKIYDNEIQGSFDFKMFLVSIVLIIILIFIYVSIFKKLISYSINYLINSNYKINFLNENVIFWTLIVLSFLSAILGKFLYTNWVFSIVNIKSLKLGFCYYWRIHRCKFDFP